MPRVLFLTESFHPVLGGGERHIRRLGAALAQDGVETTVLTRRIRGESPPEEMLDGIRVLRVGPSGPGRWGKYRMVPSAVASLFREARRYDVVVVRGTRVLGLPGLVAGRLLGKRVVLQPEVNGEFSGEVFTFGTRLDGVPRRLVSLGMWPRNLLARDADAVVAMSRRIRAECLEAGLPAERVRLLPHGVDPAHFRPPEGSEKEALRSRLGLDPAATVFVYTGRLLRGKGLETLIDAFSSLKGTGAQLLLVGSGDDQPISVEARLREMAEGLPVVFSGRVDDVAPYLRAADVFVFPSVFEALGISLLEASSSGLPCVGSRTGGIVDVIAEGESGLLVPPGDVGALAGALEALASDGALRARMGARGREIVLERFDEKDSFERYRGLFREVCRGAA